MRYTPAIAALILFAEAFWEFFVDGPTRGVEGLFNGCREHWWKALLHIQNFFHYSEQRLSYTWYISLDFQLFVISPFIIYFIHRYEKSL